MAKKQKKEFSTSRALVGAAVPTAAGLAASSAYRAMEPTEAPNAGFRARNVGEQMGLGKDMPEIRTNLSGQNYAFTGGNIPDNMKQRVRAAGLPTHDMVNVAHNAPEATIAHEMGHIKNGRFWRRMGLGLHAQVARGLSSKAMGARLPIGGMRIPIGPAVGSAYAAGAEDPSWAPAAAWAGVSAPTLMGEAAASGRAVGHMVRQHGVMRGLARSSHLLPAFGTYAAAGLSPLAITAWRKHKAKQLQKQSSAQNRFFAMEEEAERINPEEFPMPMNKLADARYEAFVDELEKIAGSMDAAGRMAIKATRAAKADSLAHAAMRSNGQGRYAKELLHNRAAGQEAGAALGAQRRAVQQTGNQAAGQPLAEHASQMRSGLASNSAVKGLLPRPNQASPGIATKAKAMVGNEQAKAEIQSATAAKHRARAAEIAQKRQLLVAQKANQVGPVKPPAAAPQAAPVSPTPPTPKPMATTPRPPAGASGGAAPGAGTPKPPPSSPPPPPPQQGAPAQAGGGAMSFMKQNWKPLSAGAAGIAVGASMRPRQQQPMAPGGM